MYEVILFDLDGTLIDSGEGITNSVAYSLKKYGIEVSDRTKLHCFIGPPLHESYQRFYGFSEEKAKEAVEYYREYYRKKGIFEHLVYEGIEDMLQKLYHNGKKLAVATSKPEVFAKKILEGQDFAKYFTCIAGANLDGTRTQKKEVILYALKRLGIKDFSGTIMVGDREHDIAGARQAGISSVGVLFGYGSYEELKGAKADYIVEKPEEICRLPGVCGNDSDDVCR